MEITQINLKTQCVFHFFINDFMMNFHQNFDQSNKLTKKLLRYVNFFKYL